MSRASAVYGEKADHYRERQRAFAEGRSGDPDWLVALRDEAISGFAELGFPSTRLEDWRYTNVAALAKLALDPRTEVVAADAPGVESLASALAHDPEALRARIARLPSEKDRAFALLNTAFLGEGAVVTIPKGERAAAPIHIRLSAPAAGEASFPRILIDAGPGSEATVVVEQANAPAAALLDLVVDAEVGANASLDLVLLQAGEASDESFQVSSTSARVARDGRFRSHTLTAGGRLVRNDLDVVLAEEGSSCDLHGLFLGAGERVVDNHSSVDHAVPHCSSNELYKGLLADRSRGVFRGRVVVRPDAQKTDATQSNPNLLLGEGAEIDTKPQLEIYADDVKCAHGATVGELDDDAVFYLRSRGIDRHEARALLVRAFASEVLESVPWADAAERLAGALEALLAQDEAGGSR